MMYISCKLPVNVLFSHVVAHFSDDDFKHGVAEAIARRLQGILVRGSI